MRHVAVDDGCEVDDDAGEDVDDDDAGGAFAVNDDADGGVGADGPHVVDDTSNQHSSSASSSAGLRLCVGAGVAEVMEACIRISRGRGVRAGARACIVSTAATDGEDTCEVKIMMLVVPLL